jgi:hypothetical protein
MSLPVLDVESVRQFLAQTTETNPQQLRRGFAHYLLQEAGALTLPVPFERIRTHHGFHVRTKPIAQRGLSLGRAIVLNEGDPPTVRRFTEGHEMMEALWTAINEELSPRWSPRFRREFLARKEPWCDEGAAEILLPEELFFPLVHQQGVSIGTAQSLAAQCQASLTATMRRMLEANTGRYIFAQMRRYPHRTRTEAASRDRKQWDRTAHLRCHRLWSSPQTPIPPPRRFVVSRYTRAYLLLRKEVYGSVERCYERLTLSGRLDAYFAESMLVDIKDCPTVMMLIYAHDSTP